MSHGGPRPGAGAKPQADVARLSRITVNVTPAELVEIDRARGQKKRGAFVRDAALNAIRNKEDS